MSNLIQKNNRITKKIGDNNGEALYKLMNNAEYGKTMENMRNRTDVRFVSNRKDYLKWMSKPSSLSQKIFDNYLVAMRKSEVTLKLVRMCISGLSIELMYELRYDYIKN